jgi:hypothetical protein
MGVNTGKSRGGGISQSEDDRGRCLFVADAKARAGADLCKIAIVSSTRLDDDCAPCAACTVLVKVEREPDDYFRFAKDVTRMSTYGDIIHADFGKKHDLWLRTFLDNAATEPDGQTRRKDAPPEPVLRVDTARFYGHMPTILADVRNDPDVVSPFKLNWPE